MATIHNRMPVILAPDCWASLARRDRRHAEELLALCRPFPSDRMISWAVSPRVGNVKNTDAALVEALPEAAE